MLLRPHRRWFDVRGLFVAVVVLFVALSAAHGQTSISVMFDNQAWVDQADSFLAWFDEAYPDIEVHITEGATPDRLLTLVAAGVAPDVVYVRGTYAQSYIEKGFLEPLTRYAQGPDGTDLDDFVPVALESYRGGDGNLYALPYDIAPYVLFYNVDQVASAGLPRPSADWSYDDLLIAARQVTQRTDDRVTRYGWSFPFGGWSLEGLALRPWGGFLFNDDETEVRIHEAAAIEALTWWQNVRQEGIVGGDFAGLTTTFDTNGVWRVGPLKAVTDLNWDMAVVPRGPVQRATSAQGSGYAITRDSKNKEAAWTFLRELTGPVGMRELWAKGSLPSRISAIPTFTEGLEGKGADAIMQSLEVAVIGRPIRPPGEELYNQRVGEFITRFNNFEISPVEFAIHVEQAVRSLWLEERE